MSFNLLQEGPRDAVTSFDLASISYFHDFITVPNLDAEPSVMPAGSVALERHLKS
jgi:hypothetical protein